MKPVRRKSNEAQMIVAQLRRTIAVATVALDRLERVLAAPDLAASQSDKGPVKRAFNAPLNGETLRAWRGARRTGRPPLIECDPELQAFILAHLPGSTYAATVAAIADAFPPERRIGKSALQAWWKRRNPSDQPGAAEHPQI